MPDWNESRISKKYNDLSINYNFIHGLNRYPQRGLPSHMYPINHPVLNPDKLTPATIALIVDWNQTLDPSFNMVKGQFRKFIESNPAHES